MRSAALVCVFLLGCAPLRVGPGRVLPPALQYDPASLAATPRERTAEHPKRLTLPNGLEVFWAEDHSSPLIDVAVLIGCGRGDEPNGTPELTSAMLSFAFNSGAGARGGEAQRKALAAVGLEPDIRIDDGESWFSFTVRTEDLAGAIELLQDALGSPRFEPGQVTAARENWAVRFESPVVRHERLTERTKARAIYGSVPTLSQMATAESIRRITTDALSTHAALCLQPANLMLAVSGDVSAATLSSALAPLGAARTGSAMKHLPAAPLPTARWLWLVPSRLTSTVKVEFVGPGLTPGSPFRAAAEVLMAGLLSQLEWELRAQMGHIYSVRGDVDVGPGSGATWFHFSTRSEVALEAVRRTIAIVQSWWERWPFDEALTQRLVAALRKNRARAEPMAGAFAVAKARLQDRPVADPRSLDEQLAQVKMEDLRAFFVKALRPDRLQVIVSGNLDATLDWEQFGPVTRVQPAP